MNGDLGERATEAWGGLLAWAREHLAGTPLGAVLVGAVILFMIWCLKGPPAPRTCGTCGVDLRQEHHQPWCQGGRWGGQQRWRGDV